MDRNKAPGGGTGKVGHKGLPPGSRAHVVCAPMDAGAFSDILSRYGDFKVEVGQNRVARGGAQLASAQLGSAQLRPSQTNSTQSKLSQLN